MAIAISAVVVDTLSMELKEYDHVEYRPTLVEYHSHDLHVGILIMLGPPFLHSSLMASQNAQQRMNETSLVIFLTI
jgi:hypothetical protein